MLSSEWTPWVERYRPKSISEIVLDHEIEKTLMTFLQSSNMPHILLYGPPGSGKTSTALAIARQMYGSVNLKYRLMELNASDERGIDVVRKKIKLFASQIVGIDSVKKNCPPYKLIILDEADSMTPDAQNALRRIMEIYNTFTRFCFICNYVSNIIEPIQSRCVKFRFRPLHKNMINNRILHICKKENVQLTDGAMGKLSEVSNGDLRKAITTLQFSVSLYGTTVSIKSINEIAGVVPYSTVNTILKSCKTGKFDKVYKSVKDVVYESYAGFQILMQLLNWILKDRKIKDVNRAKISQHLAYADKALVDGSDEMLQILDVFETFLCIINDKELKDN